MSYAVVIPCHNNREHIAEAMRSAAAQAPSPAEIIVVLDNNSDDSAKVIEATGLATRVLSTAHGNAAAARNAGAAEARSDYLAFLDADNLWLPEHLTEADRLLSGSDASFFFAPSVSSDGQAPPQGAAPFRADFPIEAASSSLTRDDFVSWYLNRGWGFATSGMVVSRARFTAVEGFNETQPRRHDFEMMMRAIDGERWAATPVATWWSRPPRGDNISADKPRCAYFALRALTLNEASYASPAYDQLLRRAALNAVKNAVFSGDAALQRDAEALAAPYLDTKSRLKLLTFKMTPSPWRGCLLRQGPRPDRKPKA